MPARAKRKPIIAITIISSINEKPCISLLPSESPGLSVTVSITSLSYVESSSQAEVMREAKALAQKEGLPAWQKSSSLTSR